MPSSQLKAFTKQVCPPILLMSARKLYYSLTRSRLDGRRVVRTVEEVDQMFEAARKAAETSDAAFREVLDGCRFDPGIDLPADPDSPEYRRVQFELYSRLSGQSSYEPTVNEQLTIDFDALLANPHPYWSKNPTVVGEQLMAIGFMIRALDLQRGDRILEFGPGSGTSTLEFAKMGHSITAVDINPLYTEIVRARALQVGLKVDVALSEMLDYQPEGRFDRVVFYECFHHCSDHLRMIERLDKLVSPGGAVVFAGEPITDSFDWPWGLRLDGISLWAIRNHGWLELGFNTKYFKKAMARYGWTTTRLQSRDVGWQEVHMARRTSEIDKA